MPRLGGSPGDNCSLLCQITNWGPEGESREGRGREGRSREEEGGRRTWKPIRKYRKFNFKIRESFHLMGLRRALGKYCLKM